MDISIEDLLKTIDKANDIIEREKLNIELYQKSLLNKINEELKPLKYFTEVVNTSGKFIEYAIGCNVSDVTVLTQCINDCVYYAYEVSSKGKLYRILLPLKYGSMEELTSYLLEDKNYRKVVLYGIEGDWYKILGYFEDVKSALRVIGGKYE